LSTFNELYGSLIRIVFYCFLHDHDDGCCSMFERTKSLNRSSTRSIMSTDHISWKLFTLGAQCMVICGHLYSCRLWLKSFGCKTVLVEPAGYKTPLTSADSFQAACDRAWRNCSSATREEYSAQYAEDCKLR